MDATALLSVASAVAAGSAIVLSVIDKLSFVQNNKRLKPWVDEANAIAGELKMIIPVGATVDQVRTAAADKAAALATKYAGSVSQAEVATQIVGEFGRMISLGDILPPSAAPAMSEVAKLTAAVQALLAAQAAAPAVPPAPAATGASVLSAPVIIASAGGGLGGPLAHEAPQAAASVTS